MDNLNNEEIDIIKCFYELALDKNLTNEDIEIINKFYNLKIDIISDDKTNILDFLKTFTKYQKHDHYNNELLEQTVSNIVDTYFKEKGLKISPFYNNNDSFTITNNDIEYRKESIINWIKKVRDEERHRNRIYKHSFGACSTSEELANFYYYVFNKYYDTIGASWTT